MPDLDARTAGPGMAGRRCESCGATMPPRTHRQTRPGDQRLVCPSCLMSGVAPRSALVPAAGSVGVQAERTTRYRMTEPEVREHLNKGHGWDEDEIDRHHPRDLHGLHVGLHEAGEAYDWAPKPKHHHVTLRVAESVLRPVAHESSDDLETMHCPYCGSGQIIGQSDGTIHCGYCQRTYTVRLQPDFPAMPQTVDGAPFPPGQPGADPGMPGDEVPGQLPPGVEEDEGGFPPDGEAEGQEGAPAEEDDEDLPAFLKGSVLRTSAGVPLPADAYLRHLAVVESGYDERVLAQVRTSASPPA